MYQGNIAVLYIFMDSSIMTNEKYAYFDTVDGTRPLYIDRFEMIAINKHMNKVNIITSQWRAL